MSQVITFPTMETVQERKIHKLLDAFDKNDRVEASGIVSVDDYFFVVFDNDSHIARLKTLLPSDENDLVGSEIQDCGFEGIAYNPVEKVFYALIECQKASEESSHFAYVHEFDPAFNQLSQMRLDWEFVSPMEEYNKGFEGLSYIHRAGRGYLLCLCEGNRCQGGVPGQTPGGGRIQVFRQGTDIWAHVTEMVIPENVQFVDYSGMDIQDSQVVIVSQTSSLLWVGELHDSDWAFTGPGKIFQFPRTKKGNIKYGNIEGVSWITPDQVVVVSDRRKTKLKRQPKRYKKKDQSIHRFNFP